MASASSSSGGSYRLDVLAAIRNYITKAVAGKPGMKCLLMDDETTPIISIAMSQSEILKEEVYLFEKIGQPNRDKMTHLSAFCFLRPSETTLAHLQRELRDPKYGLYHVFFTNTVNDNFLRDIANADELEVIKEVHEFYVDYFPINPDTFHLNMNGPGVLDPNNSAWVNNLPRIVDGIAACLLSLKLRPVVRAQKSSSMALQVAQGIKARIENSSTFHVGSSRSNPPLLLIVDRNEDPITPLLTTWTYQAMLHQLLNMTNNRIDLSNAQGVKDEFKQMVVSYNQDDFYREHLYDDFGQLGTAIQDFVMTYQQSESQLKGNLESIEDIKQFVEKYPEFKKTAGNVSKHVQLMDQMQKQVSIRRLLDVSPVEQELACHDNLAESSEQLSNILGGEGIKPDEALRLVLLYALRYAHLPDANMAKFVNLLATQYRIPPERLECIRLLREWSHSSKRTESLDLFENQNWMSSVGSRMKRGLSGVSNVFTQHQPLLKKILGLLREQKLDRAAYPFVVGNPPNTPPTEVIVFVVGGITFEEAAMIHSLKIDGFSCVLGGTGMVRPDDFIVDILATKRVTGY